MRKAWMIKMKREWRKTSIHRDVRMYMWKGWKEIKERRRNLT